MDWIEVIFTAIICGGVAYIVLKYFIDEFKKGKNFKDILGGKRDELLQKKEQQQQKD